MLPSCATTLRRSTASTLPTTYTTAHLRIMTERQQEETLYTRQITSNCTIQRALAPSLLHGLYLCELSGFVLA